MFPSPIPGPGLGDKWASTIVFREAGNFDKSLFLDKISKMCLLSDSLDHDSVIKIGIFFTSMNSLLFNPQLDVPLIFLVYYF